MHVMRIDLTIEQRLGYKLDRDHSHSMTGTLDPPRLPRPRGAAAVATPAPYTHEKLTQATFFAILHSSAVGGSPAGSPQKQALACFS
jgi:hypothetical protein